MSITKTMRLSALLLVLLMVFMSGCTGAKKGTEVSVEPWAATKYDAAEIIDEEGKYIVDKLTPVQVVEMKQVGDKKVIYHLGKPYLFHTFL